MPVLDLRTVIFLSGAIGVLMSLVLFFMHRSHRHSIHGLGQWAAAPLLVFIATLILGTQGYAPAWFSVVFANLLLLGGLTLFLTGTCRFYGVTPPRWPWLALPLVAALLYLWAVRDPNYGLRLMVANTFTAGVQAHNFVLLWRQDRTSLAGRFTLAVLGTMACLSLSRVLSAHQLPADGHLFMPTALQSFFVGSYSFSLLALTVGFVLLTSERLREQLQHLLGHDTLTGALSRHALFERGQQEVARARRTQRPISVMVMDLDHFKQVNDQHGHLVGDRVLREFALRVRHELRQGDLLGRFGGEEFVVVLPDTDAEQARRVAERIRTTRPNDDALVPVTVSIGLVTASQLALAQPPQGTLDALIAQADRVLYQAKAAGRDQVVVADSPTTT